ncbi:MAG: GNAT family N-acetyltransferase [Pseudomonadota bacterium]
MSDDDTIIPITVEDIHLAQAVYRATGRPIVATEWEQVKTALRENKRKIFIAQTATGTPIGQVHLNFAPQYVMFQRLKIPEIQDLLTVPTHRRHGIGVALINACEDAARAAGASDIGISFGLDASFGAAQRLYIRHGYVPDGAGVMYDRKAVPVGAMKPLDDLFCLMLTKDLSV